MNLRWIQGTSDEPKDLCAHGEVEFRIGADVLLDPSTEKKLTVSAAALFLLRTLSVPHTKDAPVCENLFPCCGFSMYDIADQDDVVICECPNGENFEVLHEASGTGVVVRATNGREWRLAWPEWRTAVFGFADAVSDFYAACAPKELEDEEDLKGFQKFAREWERRREKPLAVTIVPQKQ